MDRSSRQKISIESLNLNFMLDHIDLTNIYRIFHPKATEYTFFSSSHRTISRIDHMLYHKTILNKSQKTEIIQRTLSDTKQLHHISRTVTMKLEKKNN